MTATKKSLWQKLAEARVLLQNSGIKPTGKNTFANYTYFELRDFLPQVNRICADLGIICLMSTYLIEGSRWARMLVVDTDEADSSNITIEIPLDDAVLKGCHPIQNLGASISYAERYLYMLAFAISEHDALDATTGSPDRLQAEPAPKSRPASIDKSVVMADIDAAIKSLNAAKSIEELAACWQIIPHDTKSLENVIAAKNDAKKRINEGKK